MLGKKERNYVKGRERETLEEVRKNLTTLEQINHQYAQKTLHILHYPQGAGNQNYVQKILKNCENLGIEYYMRGDIGNKETQIGKVARSAYKTPRSAGIFITNPIKSNQDRDFYQRIIDKIQTKDIDGQSSINKARLADLANTLDGAIVHPTALSVLFLVQKTLETTNLSDKTMIVAGKDGNFGSMIATLLERAGAETIGFNPRQDDKEIRHKQIQKADACISVIRGTNYFDAEYFTGFDGPIIDVTTETDSDGKTIGSIDTQSCKDIPNIYIPSINGGVGTMTSALLMSNFPRCIINTEIAKGADPKIFDDLKAIQTYEDFSINNISPLYQRGIEAFGTKENFEQRLNTPNFYLNNQTPKEKDTATIMDMITKIEHGIPG